MKKRILLLVALLLALSCVGCGNNAEVEALRKDVDELKTTVYGNSTDNKRDTIKQEATSKNDAESKNMKPISLGETVSVSTANGNFEISIDNVHKTDMYDDSPDTYAASIQCVINNISYSSKLYPNTINGYDVSEVNNYIQLTDLTDSAFPFYSISGPTDGSYAVGHKLPIGGKAKESYPFLVPANTSEVCIIINNEYKLTTTIN